MSLRRDEMNYTWADHFNTWGDACRFFGMDSPAQLEAEAKARDAEAWERQQDAMEARGGPLVLVPEEIPF
jgi:hypothetical protein